MPNLIHTQIIKESPKMSADQTFSWAMIEFAPPPTEPATVN